jgi:hypothetical protein
MHSAPSFFLQGTEMPYFRIRINQSHCTTYHIEANNAQDAKQFVQEAHAAKNTNLVSGMYRVEDICDDNTEVVRMPDNGEIYRTDRVSARLKDL